MIRFRSPLALGLVGAVATLAVVLIVGVVALGPKTHANLGPPDPAFARVPVGQIDVEGVFGMTLSSAGRALLADPDPAQQGRALFFANGCATCHGTAGAGSVVGPELAGAVALDDFLTALRDGAKGMPLYDEQSLSEDDALAIFAFLEESGRITAERSGN